MSIIIGINDIISNKKKYYGKEIKGYKCKNSLGVDKWLLFLVNDRIYIIASECIPKEYIPTRKNGERVYNIDDCGYRLDFYNVLSDYYEEGKNFNSAYTEYMLDKDLWKNFAGNRAEYSIGGPTVEMFLESYNTKYEDNQIQIAKNDVGYMLKRKKEPEFYYRCSICGIEDYRYFYLVKKNRENDWNFGYLLASPSYFNTYCVIAVFYSGNIDFTFPFYLSNFCMRDYVGFRPVICLNSDVTFLEYEDGTLVII